jgi:hypothetical protein
MSFFALPGHQVEFGRLALTERAFHGRCAADLANGVKIKSRPALQPGPPGDGRSGNSRRQAHSMEIHIFDKRILPFLYHLSTGFILVKGCQDYQPSGWNQNSE